MHLVAQVDDVLEQREVRRAFDKAPHVRFARTYAVSMFNEKLQADPVFVDGSIARHAMDVFSKNSHFGAQSR